VKPRNPPGRLMPMNTFLISLFGRGIFLGKVIPKGMTNLIHIGIAILLKNEWNSYFV
jgi:hypothetical protein